MVSLRPEQRPATVRWHAQGHLSQDQAETHTLHRHGDQGVLAMQLQANVEPTFLRRHAQETRHSGVESSIERVKLLMLHNQYANIVNPRRKRAS